MDINVGTGLDRCFIAPMGCYQPLPLGSDARYWSPGVVLGDAEYGRFFLTLYAHLSLSLFF